MQILKVPISPITKKEAYKQLDRPQVIFTPNPEIILEAQRNPELLKALQKGSMHLADGNGILLANKILQLKHKWKRAIALPWLYLKLLLKKKAFLKTIPEIIHGSDFMAELIKWSLKHKKAVFFLGAKKGRAEACAKHFKKKHPKLKVAGWSHTDPGKEALKEVKASKAEVVFVAYGAPKQEIWILENHKKIPGLIHIMGVGGSFDFYAGQIKRAPKLMQNLGLEWLWRLIQEPRKRFKRIYRALIQFPLTCVFSD